MPGLGALDDAVVVGRRDGDDLGRAEVGQHHRVGTGHSAGKSMAPTPTITPWPGMSRGTDCLVPIVPGLVRVMVAPAKSSTVSLLERTCG